MVAILARKRPLVAAVTAVLLSALLERSYAQQAVFRSVNQTVAVYATVRDSTGHLVTDLTREDFAVLDDGHSTPLTLFSNDIQPITCVVLLDLSGSMFSKVQLVRASVWRLLDALLPQDRLRIGTLGKEVALSPYLTNDPDILRRVLNEELWPGGSTPLWRAVDAGMRSLAGEPGRRVILVLTDGQDFGGQSHRLPPPPGGIGGLKKRAEESESYMIYAVGYAGPTHLSGGIVELAEITGGGYIDVPSDADLGQTFADIAEELRHQYVLGFTPHVLDNRTHKLEVQTRNSSLKSRTRKSYFAGK